MFPRDERVMARPLLRRSCTPCPQGYYMPAGNKTCGEACPPGSCEDTKDCLPCPIGTFNDKLNSTSCDTCKLGWVATEQNQLKCSPCGSGETSSDSHAYCTPCKPGTYNPSTGSVCTQCAPGLFSSGYKSLACTTCPGGTYNNLNGQASCLPCGKGRYNPFNGTKSFSDCKSCPKKYYCADISTVSPTRCPANHYCEAGSAKPSVCPLLYRSGTMSTACEPSAWFFVIIAAGCLVVLVFAAGTGALVAYKAFFSRPAPQAPTSPDERSAVENLVPEPLPGPVYQGF